MKKKTSEQNNQNESNALRLHREAYQKRLRKLRQLEGPVTNQAADETEETDRDLEEEALLTNA